MFMEIASNASKLSILEMKDDILELKATCMKVLLSMLCASCLPMTSEQYFDLLSVCLSLAVPFIFRSIF